MQADTGWHFHQPSQQHPQSLKWFDSGDAVPGFEQPHKPQFSLSAIWTHSVRELELELKTGRRMKSVRSKEESRERGRKGERPNNRRAEEILLWPWMIYVNVVFFKTEKLILFHSGNYWTLKWLLTDGACVCPLQWRISKCTLYLLINLLWCKIRHASYPPPHPYFPFIIPFSLWLIHMNFLIHFT